MACAVCGGAFRCCGAGRGERVVGHGVTFQAFKRWAWASVRPVAALPVSGRSVRVFGALSRGCALGPSPDDHESEERLSLKDGFTRLRAALCFCGLERGRGPLSEGGGGRAAFQAPKRG